MAFRKYKDTCGKSPISEYEYGDNFIRVRFGKAKNRWKPNKTYQWTAYYIGQDRLDEMKALGDKGCGLAAYILKNVAGQASRIY